MKLIICCLILLAVATAAPLDSDHKMAKSESASAEVQIPAYIRKIYKKMSQAMEQDDLHMSLKYLRTVQTVHWLEPLSHDVTTLSTGPYKHLYTIRFNTSGLAEKHPNHAELFLHVHHHHSTAAQIRITSSHYQQPAVWQQHPQANGEDETAKKAQVLLRIALTSLTTGSLWKNDSILTLTVASTKPITMPSKNRHQTSVGLVLYMGGSPEAIDKLIKSPVIATSHRVMSKKETYSIGAAHKRSTGSTPCQLKKGLNIRFSEVKGGFERVLKPVVVDIGKCVGECPHFLHHLHNPSQHAEVRNLLAFREGSASDVTRASCVPTSFKPLPIVLYNDATKRATVETYNKMVATSCGCR